MFKIIWLTLILTYKLFVYSFILIYKIIAYIFRTIRFLLTNSYTRFPTLLCTLGIIFNIGINTIATIYFLYLLNCFSLSKGIYQTIISDLNLFLKKVKINVKIKKLLRVISANAIILSNFLLEDDEKTINIFHLAITANGLYHIIPLSSYSDLNSFFNNSKALYTISDDTETLKDTLNNLIDSPPPLTTLVILPDAIDMPSSTTENLKLIYQHQLPQLLKHEVNYTKPIDIIGIKNTLYENKAWLLDILVIYFLSFISKYKKIIIFIILCPFIYFIYIFFITYIANEIYILTNELLTKIRSTF